MPLDFRYHLASLSAVFGALLIGILLGVAMMEPHHLSEQVNKLSQDFKQSHDEYQHLQVLRDINQHTDQFNVRTQALLIGNRLANHNVALVVDAFVFPDDQVDAIRQALEQAGATVTTQITLKAGLLQVAPELVQNIYQQLQLPAKSHTNISDLVYRLGQNLGRGGTDLADKLQQAQLVHIDGDLTTPVSSVIFLGGSIDSPQDSLNTVDLPFLRACAESDVLLAAAEPMEAPRSVVADYQKVVQITVDNIDRAAGRIALILALSGNRRGHFGYKPNADDVAPDAE